ncbi:MAG: ABC transporter ATP-binding protein [Rhizobiales bacterium]|nr:ABC transporter ATP-binding protein [Hyphomicrobiales bacterium]
MASDLLDVRGVTCRFGGLVALDNVSLKVVQGEIVGLIGPNGAGKTTLFNVIAGAVRPSAGEIILDGGDIAGLPPHQRSRRGLARTFQITQPFINMTVEENIMVGALRFGGSLAAIRRRVEPILEAVGLKDRRSILAKGLSTGQRKRLELGRALATEPRLLLMDEVTGGVDQPSIPGLLELVLSLRAAGRTIVLIEHNMRVMRGLADRLIFLNRGSLLAEGPPDAVVTDPRVIDIYLGSSDVADR